MEQTINRRLDRAELERMPLSYLRNIDIRTVDEEKLVQSVINAKLAAQPVPIVQQPLPSSETDHMTIEKEHELQAKIDAVNEENRKRLQASVEALVEKTEVKTETKKFCEFCASKGVRHLKICTRVVV